MAFWFDVFGDGFMVAMFQWSFYTGCAGQFICFDILCGAFGGF